MSRTRSLRSMYAAAISLPFAPVIASPCPHLADRRGRSTSVCAVAACNWRAVGGGLTNRGGREAVAYTLCSTSRAGDALGRRPAVLRTASSNRTLCALWCEGYESPTWIRSWISDACPTGRDSPRELLTRGPFRQGQKNKTPKGTKSKKRRKKLYEIKRQKNRSSLTRCRRVRRASRRPHRPPNKLAVTVIE